MAELEIYFINPQTVELRLLAAGRLIDVEPVRSTADRDVHNQALTFHFDTMLVISIDKILKRNKIDSLSLEEVGMSGNPDPSSVAATIAAAAVQALKIK